MERGGAEPGEGAAGAAPAEAGTRARGIDRVIDLLDALHRARAPMRIGDLARALKAPRSTTYEIVNRLIAADILETADEEGRVFFGRAVHLYALSYTGQNSMFRRAGAELERLAAETGETAQLCMLRGDKYVVVDARTSQRLFRISSDLGVEVPIPWTASGRLLLGHMTAEEIRAFVPAADYRLPDGRRIAVDDFLAGVEAARRDGFAVTSGLSDSFTHCLAAPIRDRTGTVVATVCFIVPIETTADRRAELVDRLVAVGRGLSEAP